MHSSVQTAAQSSTHTIQTMDLGWKYSQTPEKMTPTSTTQTGMVSGTTALIDLDPLVYNYSSMTFEDGSLMPTYMAEDALRKKIFEITKAVGATNWEGFLTYGPDNYRIKLGTIKDYKGNRSGKEKPPLHDHMRSFLTDMPEVKMVFGQEADDALSIRQWGDYRHQESLYSAYKEVLGTQEESLDWQLTTVICTPDKDLHMVPGWHYRWGTTRYDEIPMWKQTRSGGLRAFYKQCLTGDTVDNIPGLCGVGVKSSYVTAIDGMDNELDMVEHVLHTYSKWYGNYAEQFLTEVGRLLWMRSKPDEMWEISYAKN